MLKIKIDSEFPNETQQTVQHEKRIAVFKTVVRKILVNYNGELEFDYISQFQQFDLKKNRTDHKKIKPTDIKEIEKLMPNCWI
jgi:hypothetical protein